MNAEEFGSVKQEDIDRLKELYSHWPQKYRELFEAKGAFILGSKYSRAIGKKVEQLRAETGKAIPYIIAESMYVPGVAHDHPKQVISSNDMKLHRNRLMYTALCFAYGLGPGEKNLQKLAERLPLGAQTPETVLTWASVHCGTKTLENNPIAASELDRYHDFLDQKYEQLKQQRGEEFTSLSQAQDSTRSSDFKINRRALTPPQIEYFDRLNYVLELLNVTTKEFDDRFKFCVAQQAHICGTRVMRDEFDKFARKAPRGTLFAENIDESLDFGHLDVIIPAQMLSTKSLTTKKMSTIAGQSVTETSNAHNIAVGAPAVFFETLELVLPPDPTPAEAKVFEYAKKNIEGKISVRDGMKVVTLKDGTGTVFDMEIQGDNIIQRYATGERLSLDVLRNKNRVEFEHGTSRYRIPDMASFFNASIQNAALNIARKQGLETKDPERFLAIQIELEAMNNLFPDATLNKEAYEAACAHRVGREAWERQQEDARRAHDALERQRQDAARRAKEEAKNNPVPYAFMPAQTIARQLQGGKLTAQYFSEVIEPVRKALDVRIPEHKALGDILFSNNIMDVIGGELRNEVNTASKRLITANEKGEIRTLNTALAAAWHQQIIASPSLQQALLNAPEILSIASGNINIVREAFHDAQSDRVTTGELAMEAFLSHHPAPSLPAPANTAPPAVNNNEATTPPADVNAGAGGNNPPPPRTHIHSSGDDDEKLPVSASQLIDDATAWIRRQLPDGYRRWRCYLEPNNAHTIILKLNQNNDTEPRILELDTHQPDNMRALRLKKQVQQMLIDMPELVPYRGPHRAGRYDMQMDEPIPSGEFTAGRGPIRQNGGYGVEFKWPARDGRPEEVMSFGLGVLANDHGGNPEAQQRYEEAIATIRAEQDEYRQHADENRPYLPITKQDILDTVRQRTLNAGGNWLYPEAMANPDFHHHIVLYSNGGENGDQSVELRTQRLRPSGTPNPTWSLPLQFAINGVQLTRGNGTINLHTGDIELAHERAMRVIQYIIERVNNWDGPHAPDPNRCARNGNRTPVHFAVNPDIPSRLLDFSQNDAVHEAFNRIDHSRLTDILNECKFMFRRDMHSRIINRTRPQDDGYASFTLSLARGMYDDRPETVYHPAHNGTPPGPTERHFRVRIRHGFDHDRAIVDLNHSINRTLKGSHDPKELSPGGVITEEYNPWSDLMFAEDRQSRIRGPREFFPDYGSKTFFNIVDNVRKTFPDIVPDYAPNRNGAEPGPPRINRHKGFAPRIAALPDDSFMDKASQSERGSRLIR